MTALGLDRRILKAFYTQYVAVLLIVLVFFVATFQIARSPVVARSSALTTTIQPQAFGEIRLSEELLINGISPADSERLAALAEVLKIHDIAASVELTVLRMALGEMDNGAIRAANLTEKLDEFFKSRGVSPGSVRYTIMERASGEALGGVVRIHPMDGGHE
jgi:hypothetical protein